jgi:hypothetical protein
MVLKLFCLVDETFCSCDHEMCVDKFLLMATWAIAIWNTINDFIFNKLKEHLFLQVISMATH